MDPNPTTPAEWQDAADAAHVLLLIDSARQYGLIFRAPDVNVDRCQEIIDLAAIQGIRPLADAVDRYLVELRSIDARNKAVEGAATLTGAGSASAGDGVYEYPAGSEPLNVTERGDPRDRIANQS